MIQFQENNPTESRMEGWTDPIHGTILATARGPTSTTAVDWHLKVKDVECNVSLTKNYCLTASMQKVS